MLFAALTACHARGGVGAECTASSDCESRFRCLYPIGAGCDAHGACDVPPSGCLPGASNLVLCACGDATVDFSCIGSNATLDVPTATGAACSDIDGGSDD